MKNKQQFFPMNDYIHSTKQQVKTQLELDGYTSISYSGSKQGFYAILK